MKSQDNKKTGHSIPSKETIKTIEQLLKSVGSENIELAFALMQEHGIEANQVPYVVEMMDLNDWLNNYGEGFGGEACGVIKNLVALKWLDLKHNQLTELPQSIGNLVALERLYLNNNQLTERFKRQPIDEATTKHR